MRRSCLAFLYSGLELPKVAHQSGIISDTVEVTENKGQGLIDRDPGFAGKPVQSAMGFVGHGHGGASGQA
jgi:hypothetical protein